MIRTGASGIDIIRKGSSAAASLRTTVLLSVAAIYLVVVVMAVEERLLPEDHAGQHAAEAPHVQTVVVHL